MSSVSRAQHLLRHVVCSSQIRHATHETSNIKRFLSFEHDIHKAGPTSFDYECSVALQQLWLWTLRVFFYGLHRNGWTVGVGPF